MNYLLIGTYTKGKSEGIYVYTFDEKSGEAKHVATAKGVENPSYMAVSEDQQFVFAVNESGNSAGDFVSAFKFNSKTGELDFINKVLSGGTDPCYLSLDEKNKRLFIANYSSGSLAVIGVTQEGYLSEPIEIFHFSGKSIHPERQKQSHLHSVILSPDKEQLFITDLGTDKIYNYSLKSSQDPFILHDTNETFIEKGFGPRHLIFNKTGKFAYLSTELKSGVSVFSYNDKTLKEMQHISMIEPDFKGSVSGADIHLSRDGKFLYASNRGDANELVVYAVDETKGTLSFVERVSCMGKTPRNFVIDPSDHFLIVANQESNDCFIFQRDSVTGKLKYTGNKIEIESPVCLKFIGEFKS